MTIETIDAGEGLCEIQFTEYFYMRKCAKEIFESVWHETPIVRRIPMLRINRRSRHDQYSPWLQDSMALVNYALGLLAVFQNLSAEHKVKAAALDLHLLRVANDVDN